MKISYFFLFCIQKKSWFWFCKFTTTTRISKGRVRERAKHIENCKNKINNFINNPRLLYFFFFFRRVKSTINLSHSHFIYLTRWFAINSEMNAISFVYIHGHLLYDWEYLLNLLLLTPHLLTIQSSILFPFLLVLIILYTAYTSY